MKRNIVFIICIIFILLAVKLVNYISDYSVDNSKIDIENKITIFLNQNEYQQNFPKISIAKECDIDTTKYILFNLNDKLAYAELRKGLNAKYKIISVTKDINTLRCEIIKTNKSKYLFAFGKNVDLQMDYIKAKVGVDDYKVTIPKEEFFISYYPVPSVASLAEDPSMVKVFDSKNNDITEKIAIE